MPAAVGNDASPHTDGQDWPSFTTSSRDLLNLTPSDDDGPSLADG